ncbi:peroxidase family protein [Hoeflea ulvae]|uniref:Heme peroxidase n=1 Tax=Hoeflea ulvae TaxID=2983764 RepID=A0ABT3YM33_9HYPH|nr:peroxidase family protein [Hoeflea ulvae]MCY0096968.1 hypothetical protein [Hoeflea ulvae]
MVNLVKHDLEFILKQIKIAEAHSAGTELTEIYVNAEGNVVPAGTPGAVLAISDPLAPYGLRTVDGSYNNLVADREQWGAADEEFLRLTTPVWRNESDDSITFGAGSPGEVVFTDGNYGEMGQPSPASMGLGGGTVVDADPRTISNLIVDQTLSNPAAIYAALVYSGYSGAELNDALNAIVAAKMAFDAAEEAAANVDPGPIAALQAIVDDAAAADAAAQSAAAAAAAQAAADQAAYDASVTAAASAETARNTAATTYFTLLTDATPNGDQVAEIAAALAAYDAAEFDYQEAVNASEALQQTASDSAVAAVIAAGDAVATSAALAEAQATLAEAQIAETNLATAQTTLDTLLETHSIEMQGESVVIPNLAPDEGLSAPYNSWFTLFGQFFDHGLDLVAKSGNGTVYIPLAADDPLYNPDTPNSNFMVLSRTSTDAPNLTTPWVDQNQTYGSTASKQLFMREYVMVNDQPVSTGHLLEGARGGLATWAEVKTQARTMLGIELTDADVTNIPLFVVDDYGEFVRGANGFPQLVVSLGADNMFGGTGADADVFLEGDPNAPISTLNAVRTGHAFLDDIAHAAVPVVVNGVAQADSDDDVGYANADGGQTGLFNSRGQQTQYDDELLDAHYVTGDGRGNENIGLSAVHHIFHSEHNRVVDQVKELALETGDLAFLNEWLAVDVASFPTTEAEIAALIWDGERLFQSGRFVTEMEYQHLVFEEFARKVQPDVDAFVFNPSSDINPAIFSEFAHVVYRFGHSMLTETVDRINHDGTRDDLDLFEAFLNPLAFGEVDGSGTVTVNHDEAAGAIIRGMTNQVGNEIDEFVTNVLRNQLLGIPLDLAAINLARGRDTGIPPLNEARRQFQDIANGDTQLAAYTSWTDFALNMKNPASIVNFIAAYGTHATIEAETTIEGKRAAAMKIVFGGEGAPTDRVEFLNATGAWAGGELGGVELIDLWVGGLAEKKMAFGGMLGSTFSFVFELQLENLQNGDRFYYLSRVQGMNLLNELENNSLAKMVLNNTDLGERGYAVPGDIFSVPDHVLYVDHNEQVKFGHADPMQEDAFLQALSPMIERVDANNDGIAEYIRVNTNDHVLIQGTSGNDHIVSGGGDDSVWGGAGDDTIEAGYGVDKIHGGDGDDIITNNGTDIGEADMLHGEGGNDVIHGGAGLALIFGNEGQDFIITGPDGKEAFGGTGNDFILGGEGGDFLLGNEGDDWIEAGNGFDTTAGDNSELFFNSTILGHDVMFAGANEHDFDAESGDDIMVQGESVMRNEGMWGFDWAIHKFHNLGANDDLKVPIFTTDQEDILRDRFDAVEALSGWKHDDTLRGDDRIGADNAEGNPALAGAENTMVKHELTQAGVDRIEGMRDFLGNMIAAPGAGDLEAQIAFDSGNMLLGGGGNDTIEGRGGNDVIDGDRWLNVRIRIEHDGDVYTADGMTHQVYLESDYANGEVAPNAVAQFGGRTLDKIMLARGLNPGELSIVREIVGSDDGSIDTAVFWDVMANYEITNNPDGSVTVNHVTQTAGVVDERGQNRISDGIDRLTNIERLRFSDVEVNVNAPATGAPGVSDLTPTEGQLLSVTNLASILDPDGLGAFSYQWQQSANGTDWTNIAGATDPSFTPQDLALTAAGAQLGLQLRVAVIFTDGGGTVETLFSAPTGPTGANWDGVPLFNNTFDGTAGDDIADGVSPFIIFGGNDTLNGNAGDDILSGDGGNDVLNGGVGNDLAQRRRRHGRGSFCRRGR